MLDRDPAGATDTVGRPRFGPFAGGALRRCIAVPTSDFEHRYWAEAPLLTPAADLAHDFSDLFSADSVDDLISARGLRTPFLRMAKNGAVLAATHYTRSGGVGATIADQVADDKVLAQLAGGATLVLQALHRTWPPLIEFGSELAAEIGHPVQINAYITPPENQGFAAHYDTHDVFVLQVAGGKRWTIHRPVIESPLPDQTWEQRRAEVAARAAEEPLIDTVLRPGDALYLPRGYLHSAVAQGELSIHLTVGVHALTGYDLARDLIGAAASDRELRRSLPMGVDVTDVAVMTDLVRDASQRLAAAVQELDGAELESVARAVAVRQVGQTRPAPLPPLAQLTALRTVQPDTTLRLRSGLRPILRPVADAVSMVVNGATITWPAPTYHALLLALSGERFRPKDFPDLESEEQLVVARRLLREGIVVPAAPVDPDRHDW